MTLFTAVNAVNRRMEAKPRAADGFSLNEVKRRSGLSETQSSQRLRKGIFALSLRSLRLCGEFFKRVVK